MFYGKLRIKSFTIDGYQFYITKVTPIGYSERDNTYTVMLTGVNKLQDPVFDETGEVVVDEHGFTVYQDVFYNDSLSAETSGDCSGYSENTNKVIVTISTIEGKSSEASSATTNGVRNCLCDRRNPIAVKQGSSAGIGIDTAISGTSGDTQWIGIEYFVPELNETIYYRDKNDAIDAASGHPVYDIAEFYAYQPNTFIITTTQCCIESGKAPSYTIVTSNTTSLLALSG